MVCVYKYTCICVCICLCVDIRRADKDVRCLPLFLSVLLAFLGSLTEPEACQKRDYHSKELEL